MLMSKSRGIGLVLLLALLSIATYVVIRASTHMLHTSAINKGKVLAEETLMIVDAWSRTVDYRCVRQDLSSILVTDLPIPNVIRPKIPSFFALQILPPPTPQLIITVNIQNDKSKQSYLLAIKRLADASKLAPVISITQNGTGILVKAIRGNGALSTAVYGPQSNFNATISSLLLGGSGQYGFSGC